MFGRIAASAIAAVLIVLPVCPSGVTKTFDDVPAPVVAAMPMQVAALDPAALTPPAIRLQVMAEPFGLDAIPVASGDLSEKWSGVEADIRAENDILARCRDGADTCPPAARQFLAIIAEGRAQTGRARLGAINRAINLAIRPMSDLAQWGVIDRWSAPLDTLTTGRGDCEDYAIAKYVALMQAGIAKDGVKLLIV